MEVARASQRFSQQFFEVVGKQCLKFIDLENAEIAFQMCKNVGMVYSIQSIKHETEKLVLTGHVASILFKHDVAQDAFLKSSKPELALDMRMDPTRGQSAAQWLAVAEADPIAKVLREYGEEKFAWRIAQAIVEKREQQPIETTKQLVDIIVGAVPAKHQGKHKATRSFQAIRIHVNGELEQLAGFLDGCIDLLESGGRLAIISFHSLEDRLIKRYMRNLARGDDLPSSLPIRDTELNKKLRSKFKLKLH
mgnify:CR=1 FL=1